MYSSLTSGVLTDQRQKDVLEQSNIEQQLNQTTHRYLAYDDRKKISLASKFNSIGGNDVMWHNAVKYLHELKIFDFISFSQEKIYYERSKCVNHYNASVSSVLYKRFKQWYNVQCGIVSCHNLLDS